MAVAPLEPWLDRLGIAFNPNRSGNQPIKCPSPEHDDSTASASLNLGKQLWNCFACGAGGSVVDLLMEVEGIPLSEALQRAEADTSGGGGEVQRQPGRSEFGLPRKQGHHKRDGGPVSPWAGFR